MLRSSLKKVQLVNSRGAHPASPGPGKGVAMKSVSILLMSGLICAALNAQPVSLFYDGGVRQAAFGASEIRRAYAGRGVSLAELGLENVAGNASPLRLVIAAGPAESQRWVKSLGSAPMKHNLPQSYSIRRQAQGNVVTIAVLGADQIGRAHV